MTHPRDAARYVRESDIWLEVERTDDACWQVWEHDREGGSEHVDVEQTRLADAIDVAVERRDYLATLELQATLRQPPWHRDLLAGISASTQWRRR